jgi:nucleotide-binding universal stress UspA family protein
MKTIQTILHPTDLSESAAAALELAVRLARAHQARLILLHVAAPPVLYGELGMTIPVPEMQKEILEADRVKLERLAAGSGMECRVVEGAAAAEILRVAREGSCDLIVMGTHGRGVVARLLLGSVASAVMRHAPCPVLAIKPARGARPQREEAAEGRGAAELPLFPVILQPTDFADHSRHAFDVACTLARGGGRVIVLHVVEAVHVATEDYEDALYERLRQFASHDPSIHVEYRLRVGESAAEILAEAAATGCDLIALGTHGRTALDRLWLGRVAEAVLHRAGCPVLMVKTPAEVPARGRHGPLTSTVF